MKKVIFTSVLFALIGISIVGCKKPQRQPISSNSNTVVSQFKSSSYRYSYNDTMLIFNTVDDFDSVINGAGDDLYNELKGLDFTCYEETLQESDTSIIEDEFLSYVLNKDFIVQIQNYIYRINRLDKTIFALHIDNASSYDDLATENLSNEHVLSFSTEDEVFELLGEIEGVEKASVCVVSDHSTSGWTEYANFIDAANIYGN